MNEATMAECIQHAIVQPHAAGFRAPNPTPDRPATPCSIYASNPPVRRLHRPAITC